MSAMTTFNNDKEIMGTLIGNQDQETMTTLSKEIDTSKK